jgi:hypothetical protein
MSAIGSATVACAAMLLGIESARACGDQLSGAMRHVESAQYEIVFTSRPAAIETGRHFSLDFAVCTRGSAPSPEAVRVDAVMPEHRHGMNYRPVVVARGADLYHADGLMLHMPGTWELRFDVVTVRGTERLTATLQLE